MSRSAHHVRLIFLALITSVSAAASLQSQTLDELTATARARIEQARASIVLVKAENDSGQTVAQAEGFVIRGDLIATDRTAFSEASHVSVVSASKSSALPVFKTGNYFLPYVLLQQQSDLTPLRLGDSDSVAVNDIVYMLNDQNAISAGRVTGTTTVKDDRAFLVSLAINSNNKGAPIFNRDGDVIGIATQSQGAGGAGLVLPSSLLASLKHLGEPGMGVGSGDGRFTPAAPSPSTPGNNSVAPTVDEKPTPVRLPPPRYTEAARQEKIQGTVMLRVLIGADGDVKAARVISGLPDGLNEKAIEAARESKFKPAMKDGKPVAYWMVLRMTFNLY